MYLSRSITWQGRTAQMVGAIPGDAVMHARPVGRGYVQLQETGALPWGEPGAVLRAARVPPFQPAEPGPGVRFAYRVQRGHGVDGAHDGVLVHNLLASYAHLRSAAGTGWAPRFVDQVRRLRGRRPPARAATRPAG
jgi:cobyrinic acid a,c-diamide synthase